MFVCFFVRLFVSVFFLDTVSKWLFGLLVVCVSCSLFGLFVCFIVCLLIDVAGRLTHRSVSFCVFVNVCLLVGFVFVCLCACFCWRACLVARVDVSVCALFARRPGYVFDEE